MTTRPAFLAQRVSGDIYNRRGYVARMETRIGYGRIIQVEILFLPQN
jgi:hypothetical protein